MAASTAKQRLQQQYFHMAGNQIIARDFVSWAVAFIPDQAFEETKGTIYNPATLKRAYELRLKELDTKK